MPRSASRLALFILVLSAGASIAQSKGWKIEKLASLGRVSTSGFIPTRRVAVNDVGQIAFVQPDGVYVREPSGVITKRMSEVGAPLTLDTGFYFQMAYRTSVGIDNNGVVYAGHNRDVFRQAPGGPTEIILSTSANMILFEPTLIGDVLVSGNGNVYASIGAFSNRNSTSRILRWNDASFQTIYESLDVNEPIFLSDSAHESVVFQSVLWESPTSNRFGRIDGSTFTDLTPLSILDIVSSLSPGISMTLGSNDAIAFVQTGSNSPLRVTRSVGSTTTSFTLDGIMPVDNLNQSDGASILFEAQFLSLSMNSSGQVAYAANSVDGRNRGIFDGPDPAIDSVLPRESVIDGQFVQIEESMVHDVTESGEVILSYIDQFGSSFLAKAISLPSVVDLVNQSFTDGLNGWQTTGEVKLTTTSNLVSSAVAMPLGSSITQDIDLPSIPFQVEVFISPFAWLPSIPEVYLGDHVLPTEPFADRSRVLRFLVTDRSLLGRSDVTFRITATSTPTIIDGIRITAVPEVNGAILIAVGGIAMGLSQWISSRSVRRE